MNPFEVARLKAQDARRVLAARGVSASAKGAELIAAASKAWRFAIRRVAHGHPLLAGADATIKVKKRWIVVRNDLLASLEAFLVAHEMGHFFLHQDGNPIFAVTAAVLEPEIDGSAAVRYVEAYGPRERQELQANVFAREFLLPRSFARDLFLEGARSASRIETDLEIPREVIRLQLLDALLLPSLPPAPVLPVPKKPTEAQEPAVNSPHRYTLVGAGPGTGKTTTLLLRLRKLLEGGAQPTGIVILTFSNKAARELVERLKLSGIKNSERVWVGTFHAFGLEFLRKFGTVCGLKPQVNVMDKLAALSVLEDVLAQLPLRYFDPLSDPIWWLPEVLDAISRCKDELIDASTYLAEVTAHPDSDATLQSRRLDAAALYKVYEEQLTKRHAVDLNDLLGRTVELLGRKEVAIEEYLHNVQHVLVDEYQDVNRASAQLVRALAKYAETVWAVGDAHQAIYAFMGASSRNLTCFTNDFPKAELIPLGSNHRSSQEIADAFYLLSQRSPNGDVAKRLKAENGESGLPPSVVTCDDEVDELNVLAAKVLAMRSKVPLASQAALVFSNAMATSVAQGLERRGVPVLFLGNLFERPEIKELLCILHLSVDKAGASLGSDWPSMELRVPHDDIRALMVQSAEDETAEQAWWELDKGKVSPTGRAALERLDELTAPLRALVSPWDALCTLLLENGQIRRLCTDASQSAVNARLAIWQFVHSCRTPDGIAQYPTIRNLFDRIRRRIRLGQDKTFRHVPPEAEGLEAVRILTAHQSKGLEFDAVHLLEVNRQVYEPNQRRQWPLIPKELLERVAGMDEHMISRMERHNLLYVGLSRARKHLTVFKRRDEELPSALDGVCHPTSGAMTRIAPPAPEPRPAVPATTEASLEDLVEVKNRCPRRAELSRRIGRVTSGAMPVYRLLDIAQNRVLKGLTTDSSARAAPAIAATVEQELRRVELWDNQHSDRMAARLGSVAQTASRFYDQGGTFDQPSVLRIGPLSVQVSASQVLQIGRQTTLRLFRLRESQYVDWLKQTLGALVKTHEQATGERLRAEIAVLANGSVREATRVQPRTIEAYETAAAKLAMGSYPAKPSDHNCPRCPYFMLCDQGRS